jgi:hypothetical protein
VKAHDQEALAFRWHDDRANFRRSPGALPADGDPRRDDKADERDGRDDPRESCALCRGRGNNRSHAVELSGLVQSGGRQHDARLTDVTQPSVSVTVEAAMD